MVKRDPRTGSWFFRATVVFADGTKRRMFGTPGTPGPYQDLPNTKIGAQTAELRAKVTALHGERPAPAIASTLTIRDHAASFLATYRPDSKPSQQRSRKQIVETHLLPHFGHLTIAELQQTDIDKFSRDELERPCAAKTVCNRLAVLSSLIKYVTGSPSLLSFTLSTAPTRIEAVPMVSVDKLVAAAKDARYRVVVLLAAEAGLRAGEIRGLQWGDVKDGQLTVRRALDNKTNDAVPPKHNKMRTIPLSPALARELAALPRRGIWVMSRLDGDSIGYDGMVEAIRELYDTAGVTRPSKPLHCLRHTFGTVVARVYPLGVVADLMGHADVHTTMRYVDVNDSDKREAITAAFGVAATRQRQRQTPSK